MNPNIFVDLADQWWDPKGPFSPLHKINPLRLQYIKECIASYLPNCRTILDYACGGGLLSEPLAEMGYDVTGYDQSESALDAATKHAKDLFITYTNQPQGKFDCVLALEVIEHNPDPKMFIQEVKQFLTPGGILILSTLNRTISSYLLGIIAAEYILRWVPKGTHSWKMFVTPVEMVRAADELSLLHLQGLEYDLCGNCWRLSSDLSVNYFAVFRGAHVN